MGIELSQGPSPEVLQPVVQDRAYASQQRNWVIWEVSYPEQTQTFALQFCDFPNSVVTNTAYVYSRNIT